VHTGLEGALNEVKSGRAVEVVKSAVRGTVTSAQNEYHKAEQPSLKYRGRSPGRSSCA